MSEQEYRSVRPAEHNLREEAKQTADKKTIPESGNRTKAGRKTSEELWTGNQDPRETALQTEPSHTSMQKRILRYQKEHPSEKSVSQPESRLQQEPLEEITVDVHERQHRRQVREALQEQVPKVPMYTDSHSNDPVEDRPEGPYEKKATQNNQAEKSYHPERILKEKESEPVSIPHGSTKKREQSVTRPAEGTTGTETVKEVLQEKGEKAVKTVKNLGSAVVITANSKRKSVMEEGQDENDALAATEDVRDELEHGLRNLPQKRKKPVSTPQKEKAKATHTDSALKSGSWFENGLHISRNVEEKPEAERQRQHRQQKEYQKKKLQRAYARAFHGEKARNELEREAGKGFRKAGGKLRSIFLPADDPMRRLFRIMMIILLVILALTLLLQGMTLFVASGNGVVLTTYPNSDEEIYAAENEYRRLEQALEAQLTTISIRYPGYQEYNLDLDDIGHDPYVLISYLTTYHWNFAYEDVEEEIHSLFEDQYELIVTPSTRQRNGETINTLEVRLINHGLDAVCRERMDEEQTELYDVLNTTKGNRDYLFNESNTGYGLDGYVNYSVPEEALNDEQFARMLREAEKYLGWPYVWGGSSPADGGFDCSGYVCWVVNNCGNGWNVGRTTAEGLRRMCAYISPADARPGDLVFFQGTYNTEGASHIGIYVGDGMMINAGDPIKYASINTPYWQQHFMQFGRLPGANPGTSSATNSGFSEEDRRLLADCIYWEARGQSFECQCYVGQVILNRVYDRRYPNTIRGVIGQPGQYANGIRSSPEPCYEAADAVLSGQVNMPRNVIYQAQFKQGSGVWKYLEGEYFCYG